MIKLKVLSNFLHGKLTLILNISMHYPFAGNSFSWSLEYRHLSDAVQGLGIPQQVFLQRKMVFVYTKTLLAGTMKPLNVLSRFENHFAIETVRF